jgi:hypothetical protein
MNKRTDREFHIALGKLLDRVRVQNEWNEKGFINASTHIEHVSKSEATRFFKALVELNLLIPSSNKRKLKSNFEVIIWKNEDARIKLMQEVIECHPEILKKKGRQFGHCYPKKVQEEILVVQEEVVNPLEYFSPQDLVAELRNRGFTVQASRQIITVEEL